MSGALIAVIVIGGCLIVGGAIAAMLIWLARSNKADEQAILRWLNEEVANRGWKYEERNDSYVSVYNADREYHEQPLLKAPTKQNPLNPLNPYHRPPEAVGAQRIVTGEHRGRPFIAAVFTVNYAGEQKPEQVIWVRTPAPGPIVNVYRSPKAQTRVRRAMGQAGPGFGHPEFDDRFEVSDGDEQFTRAVLNPAVIQYLVSSADEFRVMSLLADHITFVDQVPDHRDPKQLIPALDRRCDVLDRIPRSAWS